MSGLFKGMVLFLSIGTVVPLTGCDAIQPGLSNLSSDLDASGKKELVIYGFSLVDGATGSEIDVIDQNSQIELEGANSTLVIRVEVSAEVKSVEFVLNSDVTLDNDPPFEVSFNGTPGSFSLTAVGYMKTDKRGANTSSSVAFTLINNSSEVPMPEEPMPEEPVAAECPTSLKDLFKSYATSFKSSLLTASQSGDATVYYATSYYIQGMVSGIEATHDPQVTAWVAQAMTNLMNAADANNQWQPLYSYGLGQQLGSWQMQSAMARFAAYIKKQSPLRSTYDDLANQIIRFLYTATFKPWYEDRYGNRIPYVESSPTQWWNDKASHLITMAINLYKATKDEPSMNINGRVISSDYYKDIATRGVQAFKTTKLILRSDAWVWDEGNWITDRQAGDENAPDTSHANREAMMVVLAYESGIVINAQDVARMGNTLGKVIWNGSTESPLFANYVNGSNKTYRGEGAWTNGTVYAGFALTGAYSESAFDAVESILAAVARGDGKIGRNNSDYGKISLAGHHLRNICGTNP